MRLTPQNSLIPILLAFASAHLPQVRAQESAPTEAPALPSFSPKFHGLDCAATTKALKRLPSKDEYETTAAFQERLAQAVAALRVGKVALGSQATFVTYPYHGYDADKGVMKVQWPRSDRGLYGYRLIIDEDETSSRDYIATNRLGATVNAQAFEYKICAVELKDFPAGGHWGAGAPFLIPMDAATARQAKLNLRIAVEISLEDPYVHEYDERKLATFDDPQSVRNRGNSVYGRFLSISVFDYKTGAVLARQTMADIHR